MTLDGLHFDGIVRLQKASNGHSLGDGGGRLGMAARVRVIRLPRNRQRGWREHKTVFSN